MSIKTKELVNAWGGWLGEESWDYFSTITYRYDISARRFDIPEALSVAIIDAEENWTYFNKEDGIFKLNFTPKHQGKLKVVVKFHKGESYPVLLIYKVKGASIVT